MAVTAVLVFNVVSFARNRYIGGVTGGQGNGTTAPWLKQHGKAASHPLLQSRFFFIRGT